MKYVRLVAGNLAVLLAILVVIEGGAGYLSFVRGLSGDDELAERRHTKYDAELGWVNVPSVSIPDMYGRGVFLTTNRQGFRGDHDVAPRVPPGRVRIICSGDSFVLGYGVNDAQAWCQQLSALDARIEAVNMGQGGYGVDQAYLWYKRDGARLEHQFQIFAFITEDLDRAAAVKFWGYGKPVLRISNGALVTTNVPVPGPSSSFARRLRDGARQLRTVRALSRLSDRIGLARAETPDTSSGEMREIIRRMLADLKRLNDEHSSTLILVHLPVREELRRGGRAEWLRFVEAQAQELGITYRSLLDDFDGVDPADAARMFFNEGDMKYPGSEGHYTPAGNRFVARAVFETIHDRLPR